MVVEPVIGALALLLLTQTPVWDAEPFKNPAPWKSVEKGALSLDERPVKDSPFAEYRAIATTASSIETLCLAVFEWGTKGADSPGLKASRVLRDGDDERVVYQQIDQPVVSSRDYAMTVQRRRDPSGVCRIRFAATNELAPPKGPGVVRMDGLWGSWTFEPAPGGKTQVTYTMYSNPSGSVPPFLVHGSLKSAVRDSLLKALKKAQELEQLKAAPSPAPAR